MAVRGCVYPSSPSSMTDSRHHLVSSPYRRPGSCTTAGSRYCCGPACGHAAPGSGDRGSPACRRIWALCRGIWPSARGGHGGSARHMGGPVIIYDHPVAVINCNRCHSHGAIDGTGYDHAVGPYNCIMRVIPVSYRAVICPCQWAPGMPVGRVSSPAPG